jgi:hypothetical protein
LSPLAAATVPEALLRWIPADANAVLVVDVRGLQESALGQQAGWARRHEMDFLGGAARIPSTATFVVMAAELNLETLARSWEVGVVQLERDLQMPELARREGATISSIGRDRTIVSPRDAILIELERRLLGVHQPAERQRAMRWIQSSRATRPRDQFLTGLLPKADRAAQVVLAVDLRHLHSPDEIRRALKNTEAMAGSEVDLEAFAKLLSSAEALRMSVTATNRLNGVLHIDFGESPQPFVRQLKRLTLHLLARLGASIEELQRWEPSVQGNTFVLQGVLAERGFRRLLSVIEPYLGDLAEPVAAGGDPKQLMAETSLRYFRAVSALVDDLRAQHERPGTIEQSGVWFERFAQKIDALPILNVDPELVQFAHSLSSKMRSLALSLQGIPLRNDILQMHRQAQFAVIPPAFYAGWGWGGRRWGGGGWGRPGFFQPGGVWYQDNFREIAAKQLENVAKGINERNELINLLNSETTAIRSRLSQRYGTEF